MRNTTFTISTRNKEDIDRILLDKYHNYLTKVEDNTEVEYIESNDEYNHLQNLFVVTCKDYEVNILNKFYIDVDSEEWNSFLNFCLTRYKATRVAIHGMLDILPPPFLPNIEYTENVDNIALLPTSFKEYINQLGKQTKKHAKYYIGRINRDFPNAQFVFSEGDNITLEDYNAVTELSKERMASKGVDYKIRFGGIEHDIHNTIYFKSKGYLYYKIKTLVKMHHYVESIKSFIRKSDKVIKLYHKLRYRNI